jgi:hypothetical protein
MVELPVAPDSEVREIASGCGRGCGIPAIQNNITAMSGAA